MRFDQSICFERWAAGVGRHVRIDFCVCLLGKKRDKDQSKIDSEEGTILFYLVPIYSPVSENDFGL